MSLTFRWVRPPDGLARAVQDYGRRALVAVRAAAGYVGQKMQDEARRGAPWEDRTGNARSGLFYAVDGFGMGTVQGPVSSGAAAKRGDVTVEAGNGNTLVVTLGHTVFYGQFLELSHGGRYAIVMSTIESNLPTLERMLRGLLRD